MHRWPDQKKGCENPRAIYTTKQLDQMKERREIGGVTYRQLAEEYGGCINSVRRAVNGETYPDS